MKKLLALFLLFVSFPLAAAEHITSLGSGTAHSGITWDGAKYVFSNVYGTRVDFPDATALKNRVFRYSITTSGISAGTLRIRIGAPSASAVTGSNVLAVDSNGMAPIADNFDTSAGLTTFPQSIEAWQDSSTDDTGAFRSRCGPSHYSMDDPLVYPGLPGRSHLHQFFGNDETNAYTTEISIRKSGGSSCSSKTGPVYRSGFWEPAMLDGVGGVKRPIFTDVYYKQIAGSNVACQGSPDATHIGICTTLPNGLRYVWGYNMGNGKGGPVGVPAYTNTLADAMDYECMQANNEVQKTGTGGVALGSYTTLKALYDAGCRSPATIFVRNAGPECWDGVHVDTPDHRSHVSRSSTSLATVTVNYVARNVAGTIISSNTEQVTPCPVAFPYRIPVPEIHDLYVADAAWDAGKWRLSCDEQMSMAMDAGTCLHQDYWEAWSPTVKAAWVNNCIFLHMHCADGDMGNGFSFNVGGANGMHNFSYIGLSQGAQISMNKFGFSRYITTSGTFTGEITPTDSGNISIEGLDGFTGNVTAFSITDVTKNTAYGTPVTAHGSIAGIAVTAATFSSAATDKNSDIVLSGGNLTASNFVNANFEFVRATRAVQAGTHTFTFTFSSRTWLVVSVEDGTSDFGATTYAAESNFPGAADSKGVTLDWVTGSAVAVLSGNSTYNLQSPTVSFVDGDAVIVQVDTVAHTVQFFKNNLSTPIGTAVTWTPASGNYDAALGSKNGWATATADFSSY